MDDRAQLETAEGLLRAGRIGLAVAALRGLTAERPDLARGHELLAAALEASGDKAGAETALRTALARDSNSAPAATRLAGLLLQRRNAPEAVAVLAPYIEHSKADLNLLTTLGAALRSLGRREEAVAAYRKAALTAPDSAPAAHNLAGALGDAQRFAESEAATRRAMELGLDAPEMWLVRGRALLGVSRFDEAEAAFREALRRRPAYADAHAELAQLIWMRTEDVAAATETMDKALAASPADAPLCLAKAKVLEYAGDLDGAYAALAVPLDARPSDAGLQVGAALLSLARDPEAALVHAGQARGLDPRGGPAAAALCQANLAMGRADVAAELAEELRRDWPLDQHPVTLAATAWRILGDDRYRELYDYERLVRTQTIATPAGWPTLKAYLTDLASHLREFQQLRGHPIGQSLRRGAQTNQSLFQSEDPVIKAFFTAIDGPIRDYIAMLAGRDDVLGRRVTDGYRFSGAWSVLLRPGGHHVDHIHPMGWISSAFHVELPPAVDDGHQGWLKFGEPDIPTSPLLGPEHFLKPRAGDLVLFPSYMWHGTVPFGGDQPRLAMAFDVLPA
jgi:tetratricopeptide (TPR) repeat protein